MTDLRPLGRALCAAAASALTLGAAPAAAHADGLDTGHLSLNQGAVCALRDLGDTGSHVVRTGALPRAFDNVQAGPTTDGIGMLCSAVRGG